MNSASCLKLNVPTYFANSLCERTHKLTLDDDNFYQWYNFCYSVDFDNG